jgi:translocation and assembly module TamB
MSTRRPATHPASEAAGPTPGKPRAPRRLALGLLAGVLLVALVIGGGAHWLWRTESGTRWLLSWVPGLSVDGVQGSLFGERFAVRRLRLKWNAGQAHADVEGLQWTGAHWTFTPLSPRWFQLHLETCEAGRVAVDTGPPSPDPLRQPETLRLPFGTRVGLLKAAQVQLTGIEPMTDLVGSLELGAEDGRLHRAGVRASRWRHLEARGEFQVGADRPFRSQAALHLRASGELPWSAELTARGPLSSVDFSAQLSGQPAKPGGLAPTLDARAQLRPFEPWPLGDISAQTQALDLSEIGRAHV